MRFSRDAKEDSSLPGYDTLSFFNGYRRFKVDFCLHLDISPSYAFFEYLNVETASFTEIWVNFYQPTAIISYTTGISFSALSCRATGKSSPVTGLEWPRGFQEVKVPIFHDNGTGRW